MGVLAEGIPFEAVVYNTMKSQEKQMYFFSCVPDVGIDTRTPRNFLMRAERKVLSFLALRKTHKNGKSEKS